jgi:hypothetical protein
MTSLSAQTCCSANNAAFLLKFTLQTVVHPCDVVRYHTAAALGNVSQAVAAVGASDYVLAITCAADGVVGHRCLNCIALFLSFFWGWLVLFNYRILRLAMSKEGCQTPLNTSQFNFIRRDRVSLNFAVLVLFSVQAASAYADGASSHSVLLEGAGAY